MPDPSILVSLRGEPGLKVATMTISNPDALNALTTDMQLQFIDAITTLEDVTVLNSRDFILAIRERLEQ